MKNLFILLIACVLLVACSESDEAAPEPTVQVESDAKTMQTQPAVTANQMDNANQLGDIRVIDIEAVTNPTGTVNPDGCGGPRVDLTLTISNFGEDFPSDYMWEEWKEFIEKSIVDIPLEERSLFDVYTKVYFHGKDKKWQEFKIPVLPSDLQDRKLSAGKTMKFDYSVDVTTWTDTLEDEFIVESTIRQASGILPIESHNLLFEDSFPLELPDVTVLPGSGRLVHKDPGDGGPITGSLELKVDNIGKAPTTGPVTVEVTIKNPDGDSIAIWKDTIKEPFSDSATVYFLDEDMKAAPTEGAQAIISLHMQCPSEQYALVSDFDQSNNRVIRDIH